jgi:hypothetical protein
MRAMDVKLTAIKVEPVTASRGKKVRAEPIAQLYGDPDDPSTPEASEMHHVGTFEELEGQQRTWLPESGESPDRMDGMIWAATCLLIVEERPASSGRAVWASDRQKQRDYTSDRTRGGEDPHRQVVRPLLRCPLRHHGVGSNEAAWLWTAVSPCQADRHTGVPLPQRCPYGVPF